MQNPLRSATLGLSLCVVAATATPSHAAELHPDVQEAERAFVANDLDATDAALKRRLAENPNDVEAIWRQARNLYQRGEILAQAGALSDLACAQAFPVAPPCLARAQNVIPSNYSKRGLKFSDAGWYSEHIIALPKSSRFSSGQP